MKKLFFAIAFIAVTQLGNAQESEFKKDVLKYLEVSGQSSNIRTALKEVSKGVPAEKQAAFTIELDAAIQDLMSKTADMYMTEFTQIEVKEFLKFYNTPAGKKLTSKSDVLTEKGQLVGKAWGEGLQTMMGKYMK